MRDRLSGIFPPIPTVFDQATGEVDAKAMGENVRRWMATPLDGILALGSNGEAALLQDDEADRVIAAAREATPEDRVLLVGIGRESTRATVAASLRAASLGADAVLVRAPSFFRNQMTPDVLETHFRAVADASPVPVVLYNLPGVTGFSFTLGLVEALADHPNVVGLKETSNELDRLAQFAAVRPDRFAVLTGWAPVLYPALTVGAAGGILAVANVCPEACLAIHASVRAGRHLEALAIQRQILRLAQMVSTVHGVAGLKAALDAIGMSGGAPRAPLAALSTDARAAIKAELSRFEAWFAAHGHRPVVAD
ncbi:MAG TPA: dihydrodipicolinate synthase family protein [Vicinamibacterales bacterium]|nr:dihydrodipicolinate synthase family protein [Vicinamibacterales bacterium]